MKKIHNIYHTDRDKETHFGLFRCLCKKSAG